MPAQYPNRLTQSEDLSGTRVRDWDGSASASEKEDACDPDGEDKEDESGVSSHQFGGSEISMGNSEEM
jgi:hypothetical protein